MWQSLLHMAAGESAFAKGRLEEAEKEFSAAAQGSTVAEPFFRRAEVSLARGKYLQAEQLCRTTWVVLARKYGTDSPEVAECLDIQARACAALGLHVEAGRLANLAWDLRTKKLPKDHYDIARSINTRSALWRGYRVPPFITFGMSSSSEQTDAEESLKLQEKALPPGDPRLAPCLLAATRSITWEQPDKLPIAEKRLLAAIELVKKQGGEKSPALAEYWTELARIHAAQRKLALAEQTQQKAITLLRDLYGKRHPSLAAPLGMLSAIKAARGEITESESLLEEATLCYFSALTDIELCSAFDRLEWHQHTTEYLLEMVRRKGPTITRFLTSKHNELLEAHKDLDTQTARGRYPTLELLTALRRAQNKPDPLPIILGVAEQEETIFPNLPVIDAALVNKDYQKKPILYKNGGDYRSGRAERWRFSVRGSQGNIMRIKPREDPDCGGFFTRSTLKANESWDTVLDMRRYIDLPPGDYTVTVEYSDQEEISSLLHTAAFLLCRSDPFKLHVQPRVIDVTRQDREAVKAVIASLDEKSRVKILEGTYAKADHAFIALDSPPGKILTLGWRAVPQLLDALEDDKLAPQRRAWVLALLFSITSWNDPTDEPAAIGPYDFRGRGWAVSGGRNGKTIVLGAGSGSGKLVYTADKIDDKVQRQFATKWKAFRDYIVIREKNQ
jgi:tetratricopeptide (TPR) repeat protein